MDYQFRLVERGGGNISLAEYKDWRTHGMAFVYENDQNEPDISIATQPNMSLVSSVKRISKENEKVSEKSFFGDIVTGPFISYGLDPSYEALSVDKTKTSRRSQELALTRMRELIESIDVNKEVNKESTSVCIEIVFLPLSAERDIKRSSKEFESKFEVSFIACSVAHLFTTEFASNMVAGGSILVETPLFLLHMAKEIQEKFKEHLLSITTSTTSGLELKDDSYEPLKTSTVLIKKE